MNEIIALIGSFTIANQLIVEFIKTNVFDKYTTLIAFITAQLIVWSAYLFNYLHYSYLAVAYIGLGVGLASTVGFDKVKEVLEKFK